MNFLRFSIFVDVPFQISHCPSPISHLPFLCFRCPGPAECAERLNPPPLPYGKSWRVKSTTAFHFADLNPQIQICRSQTPLISPPSAPAHSARPPQNMRRPGFCDFQKTLAVAERAAKKVFWTDHDLNLHQKCNF